MKLLVTGATGLIGSRLVTLMSSEGHTVIALSRGGKSPDGLSAGVKWDALSGPPPAEALEDIDAIVHLAGEPIAARRWSKEQKERIADSRILGTRNLIGGLREAGALPLVMVGGSAVGFYGNRGDETLTEVSPPGDDFLAKVCVDWERENLKAASLGARVVLMRTGVVLAREGGALKKMLPPFKLGVGGRLGNGKQWFPWIHVDDEVQLIKQALENPAFKGPVNSVAPGVVTNAEFTKRLGKAINRPTVFPVPAPVLKLLLGEMSVMLLGGQRVGPQAAIDAGYKFKFSDLDSALRDLFS